jgi:hypothetical protein
VTKGGVVSDEMNDELDEEVICDEELRKRLFSSPTPEKTSNEVGGDEGERGKRRSDAKVSRTKRKTRRAGFRLSSLTVMLFLVLCALALFVTLHFNNHWRQITWKEFQKGAGQFFSNEPLNGGHQKAQLLFGLLGALPLAAAIGTCAGAFTCLFMYYDSDVPGDFPPTPVSPRKGIELDFGCPHHTWSPSQSESRWHLGYIFVPVNTLVAFSLALCYLRLHLGFGIV